MKTRLLFTLAILTASSLANVSAQDCSTAERHRQLKAAHPEVAAMDAQLSAFTQQQLNRGLFNRLAKTTNDTTYYDIPVVIHVVHDYGIEYLSDNTIFTAFEGWKETFLAQNADTVDVIAPFKKWIGNPRVRLHLATKDPAGAPSRGITRRQSYHATNASDQSKMDMWPQDRYLNIWLINSFSSPGLGGYSYYPSSAHFWPWIDGVIALASGAASGKLMEHEIGHYLNLMHVWGDNNDAAVACGDDDVDDTPPTQGHLSLGCIPASLYDTSCSSGYSKTYTQNSVTTVIDYPDTANAQNIMDYTQCRKMFTKGQGDRMRAALNSNTASRNNLWSESNLALTGAGAPRPDLPPVAAFSVNRAYGDVTPLTREPLYFAALGADPQFSFSNRSWNDTITSVQWTFSNGAALPSATANNVRTSFSQPGWVQVTLTATGNGTGSTTLTNARAVYVADSAVLPPAGYVQEFNGSGALDKWPAFNYYNNDFKWELFSGTGMIDNTSLRYRSYDARPEAEAHAGAPDGDRDDIFTPGFDLSGSSSAPLYLNFYTAAAARYLGGNSGDELEIAVSNDLGRSWVSIDTLAGAQLQTVEESSKEFVPTWRQWVARTVAIPDANRTAKAYFRFRYRPASGSNNLYLDRFSISNAPTEVTQPQSGELSVDIYPNPAGSNATLSFSTTGSGTASIGLRDIVGRKLYEKRLEYSGSGRTHDELPVADLPAGMYLVELRIGGTSITKRLMVQ